MKTYEKETITFGSECRGHLDNCLIILPPGNFPVFARTDPGVSSFYLTDNEGENR